MGAAASGLRWVDRPMTDADIAEVVEMEQGACAHPIQAWTADNYRSSLRAGYWARVRCEPEGGRIVAVCVVMDGVDEAHLLNVAVHRDWHGRGLARALLQILAERCADRAAQQVWLEVRPSNQRARALYERMGYEAVGIRKAYYPAPQGREDAVVMRLWLRPEENTHALD
ncbi:ribosomal protein S18-alanine N-acetyltransferase [Aquabacterium fontiphilum]|jgi:ribosomal-protein-alanine N-acetyltransferase|nr:ribosomal protein S18-alanine N-acetyltransferase [Aquabacterium fontiphilum]